MTSRPLIVSAVVLLLGLAGALAFAQMGMRAPTSDVQALALLLPMSGAGALLLGAVVFRWLGGRLPSLHLRIVLAWAFGIVAVLAVVLVTSMLMFLNNHDLSLLLLLLGFSSAVSVAFGYSVASSLSG